MFVCNSANLYGTGGVLIDLLGCLDRNMFDPYLVVPSEGPIANEAKKLRVPVFIISHLYWLSVPLFSAQAVRIGLTNNIGGFRIALLARRLGVNLIYSNGVGVVIGALGSRVARIPHVWHVHETIFGAKRDLEFIRKTTREVIVVSEKLKMSLAQSAGIRARVVHCCPTDLRQTSRDPKERLRAKSVFGFGRDQAVITMVGSICDNKGQIEMVRAFTRVNRLRPSTRLLIVGSSPTADKAYELAMKNEIVTLGLQHLVTVTGRLESMTEAYEASDLLVILSKHEGLPRVLLEALQMEIQVVATRVGGIPEVLGQVGTGILIDSRSEEIVSAVMLEALSRLGQEKERIAAARRFVESNYSRERMVAEVSGIILDAMR
jgi:glycosyltransferase involved in cell wall biosynthesis